MSIIVLIPAVLCIAALFIWEPAKVFRDIVLPVLLFCPLIFAWKVTLLPPIDFSDAVLLPLGIAIAIQSMRRWRISIMDLWLLLLVLSTCWSDHTTGQRTASIFELFDAICTILVPYMVGKLLVEPGTARAATLRRIVILLLVVALIASSEWASSLNLWRRFLSPLFPADTFLWDLQFRGGRVRITGPFWQAELAGTMFMLGALLALWLGKYQNWAGRFRSAPWIPFRKSTWAAASLILAIFLTQSRGPELGLLFGLPVALIGRSRRVLRATLLVATLLALGGAVAYTGIMKYSATKAPTSEEQQTAQYRAIMIENYVPMAEHSGPWGLGPNFPRIGTQVSIDNEYLFLALTQGWVGLGTFLLLSFGTLYNLIWAAIYNPEKDDRAFAFTLLGMFLGFLIILATVYLGLQPRIFFFLIVGWAQAIKVRREPQRHPVFQQIYT
jgi:hypothetical protein